MDSVDDPAVFQTIFDSAPVGIALADVDGRFLRVNRHFTEMLGYTESEAVSMKFMDITHPDDRADSSALVGQVRLGVIDGYRVEKSYLTKAGERLWCDVRISVQRGVGGQVDRWVGVMEDITSRRRYEAEMLRAAKLESLGVLAGGIAHDFNNLLTTIVGNVSVVRAGLATCADCQHLDPSLADAERAAFQASALAQQLLTFSKGGEPVTQLTTFAELIDDAVRFSLSGSDVGCEIEIPLPLWPARVDPGQIGQVLQNLLLNARQSMLGGGTITLRANNTELSGESAPKLKPGPYLKVDVIDSGCGIPDEQLPKIFDPYYSTKPAGSGLGLAVVYSVVHRHNGHVAVASVPGAGSTFTVWLPAETEDLHEATAPSEQGHPVPPSMRVLVMDDDPTVGRMLTRMLTRLGHRPVAAADGREAVEKYLDARTAGRPFELVILDLTVPGGWGGVQTLEELRKLDPSVMAVVSSGYSDAPVMASPHEFGFQGVLPKPYGLADLHELLDQMTAESD